MGEGKYVTISDVRWGIGLLGRPRAAQLVVIIPCQEQESVSVLYSKRIAHVLLSRVCGVFVEQRSICECAEVESIDVR